MRARRVSSLSTLVLGAVLGFVTLFPSGGHAAIDGHFCGAGLGAGPLTVSLLCQEMPPFPVVGIKNIGIGLILMGPETSPTVVQINCTNVQQAGDSTGALYPPATIFASASALTGGGHYVIRILDRGFTGTGLAQMDSLGVKKVSEKPLDDGACGNHSIFVPVKPLLIGNFYSRSN